MLAMCLIKWIMMDKIENTAFYFTTIALDAKRIPMW